MKGKEKALAASRKVREELGRYGLLALEVKLAWGARQTMVWTSFVWETRRFKLFVMEGKLERVENLLGGVVVREERFV